MSAASYFARKRVAITGGSSGIGLALARRLVEVEAEVVLVARSEGPLEEARDALLRQSPGARVSFLSCDVTQAGSVEGALRPLGQQGLEVLVCSAGITLPGRFLELDPAEFGRQMDTNYFGTVNACRAVLPHFVSRRAGHLIQVGSLAGVIGIYGYSAYAASKFAVAGLMQVLRAELRPHGVRVTLAHPPDTATPMLEQELPLRPAETQAIAGSAPTLSADAVARSVLEGAARGDFDVWCDLGSRMMGLAQGTLPSLVRRICDSAQDRATAQQERLSAAASPAPEGGAPPSPR